MYYRHDPLLQIQYIQNHLKKFNCFYFIFLKQDRILISNIQWISLNKESTHEIPNVGLLVSFSKENGSLILQLTEGLLRKIQKIHFPENGWIEKLMVPSESAPKSIPMNGHSRYRHSEHFCVPPFPWWQKSPWLTTCFNVYCISDIENMTLNMFNIILNVNSCQPKRINQIPWFVKVTTDIRFRNILSNRCAHDMNDILATVGDDNQNKTKFYDKYQLINRFNSSCRVPWSSLSRLFRPIFRFRLLLDDTGWPWPPLSKNTTTLPKKY
jgi:hypothetical protein